MLHCIPSEATLFSNLSLILLLAARADTFRRGLSNLSPRVRSLPRNSHDRMEIIFGRIGGCRLDRSQSRDLSTEHWRRSNSISARASQHPVHRESASDCIRAARAEYRSCEVVLAGWMQASFARAGCQVVLTLSFVEHSFGSAATQCFLFTPMSPFSSYHFNCYTLIWA